MRAPALPDEDAGFAVDAGDQHVLIVASFPLATLAVTADRYQACALHQRQWWKRDDINLIWIWGHPGSTF
jgi:hypothetical protein